MERRHILFIVLVILVLGTHFALNKWLAPQQPPAVVKKDDKADEDAGKQGKKDKAEAAKGKDEKGQAEKAKPVEKAKENGAKDQGAEGQEQPAAAAIKPAGKFPHKLVTIGSLDPESGFRELITVSSRGASLERVELGGDGRRRYFDTDDDTGYLGHLAFQQAKDGLQVGAVGNGTPASLAKESGGKVSGGLAVGDVITAIDGTSTGSSIELDKLLQATKPGQSIDINVLRPVNGKTQMLTFRARLSLHPLELIRSESHVTEAGIQTDPPSLLLSLDRIGDRSVRLGEQEIRLLPSLRDDNWELTDSTPESAEFTYRLDAAALDQIGQKGSLRIVKRFKLNRAQAGNAGLERPFSLWLNVEIHSDLSVPTPLAYRLSGPNGLPLEGWWYLTKLHPQFMHSAGARDVAWKQPDGYHQLLGCRAIYDGALKAKKDKETFEAPLLKGNKPEPLDYAGVDTQFFAAMILPQPVGQEEIKFRMAFAEAVQDVSQLKKEYARAANVSVVLVNDPVTVQPGEKLAHDYEIFLGPKDADVLAGYQLDSLIEKGWRIFRYPTNLLSAILHFLYGMTRNYGIAIVLLTVMVRACMLPLSIKQAKNAAKMQELAPEIKKIKEKYASETEKQMKELNALYKKHNFNMFGGCLPVLVQLPIFIGLYRCLSIDIALRDAPLIPGFWWASNLAGPDKLFYWKEWLPAILADETGYLGPYFNVLPVITCVLFIVQQQLFMPPATDEQTQMQQSMMKYMTIFMGVMFFKVPAGLCIYFIISTSWSIVERTFLPKFKPAEGGSPPTTKVAAAGPSSNGSPADKRGPKMKKK